MIKHAQPLETKRRDILERKMIVSLSGTKQAWPRFSNSRRTVTFPRVPFSSIHIVDFSTHKLTAEFNQYGSIHVIHYHFSSNKTFPGFRVFYFPTLTRTRVQAQ